MTASIRNLARVGLLAIAAAALLALAAGPGLASGQQPQPAQTKPPAQPGQPAKAPDAAAAPAAPAAPLVNKEEEDAYKAMIDLKIADMEQIVQLGEDFLKKFPESRYRESVHSKLASAYMSMQQIDKMYAAADKALELNPDNVDMLSLMALALPRGVRGGELDIDQKLQRAEKYSKRALELLEAMAKPAHLTDEEFARAKNEKLAMAHSGLGMVHFRRNQAAEMVAEFELSTRLSASPDPVELYLLGDAYQRAKRYTDAADVLGRCAEVTWQWQDQCKKGLDLAKKAAASAPPAAPKP